MARMGSFDFSELKKLQKNLNKLQEEQLNIFMESCAKELAARLLEKVIKRTPVGDYTGNAYTCTSGLKHSGHSAKKTGGTLRKGWTAEKGSGSEGLKTRGVKQFLDTINVNHYGDTYVIEVINSIEYASYVEFGHRTPDHKGWVPGHFMMTISEQEIEQAAPRLLEKKIRVFPGGVFK